jgi:glutamyl-tRNA reductase
VTTWFRHVNSESPSIVAIVAHASAVRASDRARFGTTLREAMASGLIVQTCHRVELYATSDRIPPAVFESLPGGVKLLDPPDAARHAITVAVGLDSAVVGEDQILHQLRTATAAAQADGRLDPEIERLMSVALRAGRLARSWRSGPVKTLADAALEAVERRRMELSGAKVLIVGTGEMGRLAADRARVRGAQLTISSRTIGHARDIAQATGSNFVAFDPGRLVSEFAVIVVALHGPWILAPETIDALIGGPAIVVDLSMPSALPAGVALRLGDRWISIDDLAVSTEAPTPVQDHGRMAALVDRSLSEYLGWLEGRHRRLMAADLVRLAESERNAELDRLWRAYPDVDPEMRSAIERMSRHLTNRLLRAPLERLGQDADGRAAQAARDLFAL